MLHRLVSAGLACSCTALLIKREPRRSMEQSDDHSTTREVDCASPR